MRYICIRFFNESDMVVVAQLVRALDCGSRGRRFEPGLPPKSKASLFGEAFFVSYGFIKTLLKRVIRAIIYRR